MTSRSLAEDYLDVGYRQQRKGHPPSPLATPMLLSEIDDDSFAARPVISEKRSSAPVDKKKRDAAAAGVPLAGRQTADQDSAQSALDDGLGEVVVISGGSGFNALVGATPGATHVMPISDDGGSSSEIIRVLGGPSIGDLRSRLVRLIPTSTSHASCEQQPPRSNDALYALLAYRLPTEGRSRDIKQEWMDILEGRHHLWQGIEPERKECIRGFLVHFESEILRRVHRNFDFRGGSIGNFFLAAAQKFFRSLQSAIFLFSATTLINTVAGSQGGKVLPAINTNHTATIAVLLENKTVLVGQCEISHPAPKAAPPQSAKDSGAEHGSSLRREVLSRVHSSGVQTPASGHFDPFSTMSARGIASKLTVGHLRDGLEPYSGSDSDDNDGDGDAVCDLATAKSRTRKTNIVFAKDGNDAEPGTSRVASNSTGDDGHCPLQAPIERLFYVNAYGSEVGPAPNPEYLASLHRSKTLLYSCGSLWTSIVPCVALRGIASAISTSKSLRYKVLLLNTTPDRETKGLDALDFLKVLQRSMQYCDGLEDLPLTSVFTHVIYHPHGRIPIKVDDIEALGLRCVPVDLPATEIRLSEDAVRKALENIVADGSPHQAEHS